MEALDKPIGEFYAWGDRQHVALTTKPTDGITQKYPMASQSTRVGIEVELEGFKTIKDTSAAYWTAKQDGSLREAGMEFVSHPIYGAHIPMALVVLADALNKDVKFTPRTSIHVHVDVRDLKCKDILNMGMLYLPFERLFYKLAGPERYGNIFCTPVQETRMIEALSGFTNHQKIVQFVRSWDKYSGMNFLPIHRLGTVEFRHMSGNLNVKRIVDWVNVLFMLRRYAKNRSFEQIADEIQPLNTSSAYEAFMQRVFGDHSRQFYDLPDINWQRDMEDGVAAAKLVHPESAFFKKLVARITPKSGLLTAMKVKKVVGEAKKLDDQPPDWQEAMMRGAQEAMQQRVRINPFFVGGGAGGLGAPINVNVPIQDQNARFPDVRIIDDVVERNMNAEEAIARIRERQQRLAEEREAQRMEDERDRWMDEEDGEDQ